MRQKCLASIGVGLLITGMIVILNTHFAVEAQRQPPPPTPKGQLGGAPRLTPLIGGETTVAPAPPTGTPVAATARDCTVAPLTLQEVRQLTQGDPTSSDREGIVAVPSEPANTDALIAVADSVSGFVTCLNNGDPLRALAYMSDGAVRQSLEATGWDDAAVEAHLRAARPRDADQRIQVRSISQVSQLSDGQVVATVELADPARFPLTVTQQQWRFVRSETNGRWLIAATSSAY